MPDSITNHDLLLKISNLEQEVKELLQQLTKEKDLTRWINSVDDILIIFDTNFVIEEINESGLKIFSITREEVVGKKCHEINRLKDFYHQICPYYEVNEAKENYSNEIHIKGLNKFFEVKMIPIYDDNGLVIKYFESLHDITKQKTENDFNTRISEISPIAIILVNKYRDIVFANKNAVELLDLIKDPSNTNHYQLPNIKITDFDDAMVVEEQFPFVKVKNTKKPVYDIRHAFTFPNGRKNFLSINAAPLLSDEGEFEGMVANLVDISNSIKEEQTSKENEDRLESIIQNSFDTIVILDNQLNIKYLSPSFTRFYVYRISEWIGKKVFNLVHPDYLIKVKTQIEELINMPINSSVTFEFQLMKKNGEFAFVECVATNMLMHKMINGIVANFRDITERKKYEAELIIERDLLQQLMDNTIDAIYFKDVNCRFIRINKAEAKLLGIENLEDVVGKNDFDFFAKKIAQNCYADDLQVIKTARPLVDKVEMLRLRHEKNNIWVSATKIALKDENGKIVGMVGISRDITERKLSEQDMIRAKEKAEESDKLKSAFLANLSHEIRTPLNGILGFSQLLNTEELSTTKIALYTKIIHESSHHLLTIINDIIDISKIASRQFELKEKKININELMDELFNEFNYYRQEKNKSHINLELVKSLSDEKCHFITDLTSVKRILKTLLDNAFKFTHKGSVSFGYHISQILTSDFHDDAIEAIPAIQFYVKDTGIGIVKEKVPIIFDKFRQGDETHNRQYGGTGLGLAISKGLVELLGGKIWVESEKEKGSVFYFSLPLKGEQVNEIIEKKTEQVKPDYNWKNKLILIVEDDWISYRYLEEILKKTHVKIIRVDNGMEAIETCKKDDSIDLILMDIQLPGIDGIEATKQIKQLKPGLPIIAQTAFALETDLKKCIEAGCDNYLAKPIYRDKLLEMINPYLTE